MATRNGSAEWQGDLPNGSGHLTVGDGAWEGDYSFTSRFEEGEGTNPEELIAAAHAACYSMALSNILAEHGHEPRSVKTSAKVHLRNVDGAPTVAKIDIKNDPAAFTSAARLGALTPKTTGGSTGEPITILKTRQAMAWELAATWRGYSWAGIDIGDRQARFWGVPLDARSRLRARLIDFVAHRRRCSAFAFDDESPTTFNGREVPTNVAQVCTLTYICTAFDVHLTDEGAAVVGRVVADAARKAGVS